jgi:anti-anti-sigma regulatory factor
MLKLHEGWQLDTDRGPDWLLVSVKRPARNAAACPLADVLWTLLEQHFTYRLVLELDPVTKLDDALIEQLLLLHERIGEHGGILRVCGLSPENRRLLLARNLVDWLVPYADREEAVTGGSVPRHPR